MFGYTPLNAWLSRKPLRQGLFAIMLLVGLPQPLLAAPQHSMVTPARHQLHVAYVQGEGDVQGLKVAVQRESAFLPKFCRIMASRARSVLK